MTAEALIGYRFKRRELLEAALTHSSAGGKKDNYERLEFLGDRVLALVIAETLYARFPGEAEGDLAKRLAALAQGELIAEIATALDLGPHITLSGAEAQAGGAANTNILADALEALIGALYLDGGYDQCRDLIVRLWEPHFDKMKIPPQHPKTALQEWAQARGLPLPSYAIVEQDGPDHAPVFTIEVAVKDHPRVRAQGRSRQDAEKQAARLFLENAGEKASA